VTSAPQLDVIAEQADDAIAKGASLLTGGQSRRRPRSFAPTVLIDVDDLANDSPYGLQASVFSRDLARAEGIAGRLDCGVVCINDAVCNYSALSLPMGGLEGLRALAPATVPPAFARTAVSNRCSSPVALPPKTRTCAPTIG
jgi:acyl-CoA reductase-like NAD-dependent aldehyde dehydrogenase